MKSLRLAPLLTVLLIGCKSPKPGEGTPPAPSASSKPQSSASPDEPSTSPRATAGYRFEGGFPSEETRVRAEEDVFVARAVELYGRYLPTLAMHAARLECERVGAAPNHAGVLLDGGARQRLFAPSLDVPSGLIAIDLESGPVALEIPPGALTALVSDQYQDLVLEHAPTPPSASVTKYLLVRDGDEAHVPPAHQRVSVRSRRALVLLRALPVEGSVADAQSLLRSVTVHDAGAPPDAVEKRWISLGRKPADFTPVRWERSLDYFRELHAALRPEFTATHLKAEQAERASALERIGIHPGKSFAPSEREKKLLGEAARLASDRLRVQAFADHSTEVLVWSDRQWEWLGPSATAPGKFLTPASADDGKWAFQTAFLAPALGLRAPDTRSFDWFTTTDRNGTFLDGSSTYRLKLPLPVPAKSFWSVTLHDPKTRAELDTKHQRAILRSFAELFDLGDGESAELFFGPTAPAGQHRRWIETLPDQGFVVHFRLHQPASDTLESTWQLGDLEAI